MTTILALDTSTQSCSCALSLKGEIFEIHECVPRQHGHRLLPMIHELMEGCVLSFSDLDCVAYGRGPGSFTGLRVAAGVTQGIAAGAGLPAIPVSSLAAIALQAGQQCQSEKIFSCIDARMGEIYWGLFLVRDGDAQLFDEERVGSPESLPEDLLANDEDWFGAGNGMAFIASMPPAITRAFTDHDADIHPRASAIANLAALYYQRGQRQSPQDIAPLYIRDQVTQSKPDRHNSPTDSQSKKP